MDYKILYTETALGDLEEILDYIRRDSEAEASRFGTQLLNHVELLSRFPRLGVVVPAKPGVRMLVHSPVRVYYDESRRLVEIVHFWHGAGRLLG